MALVVALLVARSDDDHRGVHRRLAAASLFAAGLVIAVTLTPGGEAIAGGAPQHMVTCDVSRLAPLPPAALGRLTDESLNVYLFIPLGIALAFVPASRWSLLFGSVALALPIAIEMLQAAVPSLGRVCQSGDVIDNWSGLALGLAVGLIARAVRHAVGKGLRAGR